MSAPSKTQTPTPEEIEDVLFNCRFGELEELQAFVESYGKEAVAAARDERGNTVLHMCCGNGHLEILNYLLPLLPSTLLSTVNESGSPPMHWAVSNNHVEVVKTLVELPEEQGGGLPLLKQKNASGRDAFLESMFAGEGKEEVSGWIEGYLYRVEGADDEDAEGQEGAAVEEGDGEKELRVEEGDEVVTDEAKVVDELAEKTEDLEVKA